MNGDLILRLPQGQCPRCRGYATQGGEFLPESGNVSLALEKITLELVPLTMSFAALSEVWKKTRGVELSQTEIERIVLHRGQQIRTLQQEAYEQEPDPLLQEAPERLYLSCDGTCCHAAEPGQRKLEGCLGMVFTDPRAEVSKGRFELLEKRYCATFFGKDDLGEQLERQALAFRIEAAKEVLFLADGEQALWEIKAERFPQARGMLDWNHVSRKLPHVLGVIESPAARKKRAEQLRALLWEGKTLEALRQLRRLHTRLGKEELSDSRQKQREQLGDDIGYVEANRPWLINYAQAQQKGYFVSSSIMESAINRRSAPADGFEKERTVWPGSSPPLRTESGSTHGRKSVKEQPDSPCGFVIRPPFKKPLTSAKTCTILVETAMRLKLISDTKAPFLT